MKNEPLKEGYVYNGYGLPEDLDHRIWVNEVCPKDGHQLYSYDNGQGCGIVCSKDGCDYRKMPT